MMDRLKRERGANFMRKESESAFAVVFTAVLAVFFSCGAHAAEEEAVFLPSRFADAPAALETNATTEMVEEWMYATGAASGAVNSQPLYAANRNKRYLDFEGTTPRIFCKVGMITDIELEPGERVENFLVPDGQRWSISAAWSGPMDNIVTHVLVRTFFPGLRSKLAIITDRRVYEMELVSGIDVSHMAYVGFRYPADLKKAAESEIEPGKYRDLLVKYGIIEGPEAPKEMEVRRVDGAELNFRYTIKPIGKKKLSWSPRSVYDADGKTYIVMPRRSGSRATSLPLLYIVDKDERILAIIRALKNDLYVTDRVFDEAIMKLNNDEVSIRRVRSSI